MAEARQLKMKGADLRPKWDYPVKVVPVLPVHAQEVVFAGMDLPLVEGIQFGHLGMAAQPHDRIHGIIDGGVAEWKLSYVDAIVDAAALGKKGAL